MLRFVYATIFVSFLPFLLLKYLLRSRKNPNYRYNLNERLALKLPKFSTEKRIHIHLVSVGEANAASTLLNSLLAKYPTHEYLITVTTPSGRNRVEILFGALPNVHIRYLPFDIAICMERFVREVKPQLSIILETELWPYFLLFAKRYRVPVALVNARLSKKSLKGYRRMPRTSREMLTSLDIILAQYRPDQKRLIKLGCHPDKIATIGNIKFDIQVPTAQIEQGRFDKTQLKRPVWLAASTHEGEEVQILTVHKKLLKKSPNTLLIIVPRHQERFEDVSELVSKEFTSQKRSDNQQIVEQTQVFIGDTIGEMYYYLSMTDISFIGGSLIKCGGHNPIEPASMGLPIISGKEVYNFKTLFRSCVENQFCTLVDSKKQLLHTLELLFNDPQLRSKMAKKAQKFVKANQGSTEKMLAQLSPYLENQQNNDPIPNKTTEQQRLCQHH